MTRTEGSRRKMRSSRQRCAELRIEDAWHPRAPGTRLAPLLMDRYRRLVESSPDGILIVDDERIAFANAAAVDLFGANGLDRLSRRSLFDLLDPECHEAVREHIS